MIQIISLYVFFWKVNKKHYHDIDLEDLFNCVLLLGSDE